MHPYVEINLKLALNLFEKAQIISEISTAFRPSVSKKNKIKASLFSLLNEHHSLKAEQMRLSIIIFRKGTFRL